MKTISFSTVNTADIFRVLQKQEKEHFPEWKSVECIEKTVHPKYVKTVRRITLKNILPKFLSGLLPFSTIHQISTYTDTSHWYTFNNSYHFNITCPDWYCMKGNVLFHYPVKNQVTVNMDFDILSDSVVFFQRKDWIVDKMTPVVLGRYIRIISRIDSSLSQMVLCPYAVVGRGCGCAKVNLVKHSLRAPLPVQMEWIVEKMTLPYQTKKG